MRRIYFAVAISAIMCILNTQGIGQVASLRGLVTDAKTGEPMSNVRVIVTGTNNKTLTDKEGSFEFNLLDSGSVDLYVTMIGYGLVKKQLTLNVGNGNEVSIVLHPQAAQRLDEITVTSGPFDPLETNVSSEQSVNKQELQSLSTVLASDPIRAVQGLPGVQGNDDFKSEFTLRGAGFKQIGFFLDGISMPENPAHTVFGQDNAGSLSMFNADTISSVTLMPGPFPSKYGDGTGGMISLTTRDGNRVKPSVRLYGGALSSSGTVDGPMPGKNGAWLLSFRKSYVKYVLNAVTSNSGKFEGFNSDFTSGMAKANYDLTPANQIGVNVTMGWSDFDPRELKIAVEPGKIAASHSRINVWSAYWNFTQGTKFVSQTRLFNYLNDYSNADINIRPLQEAKLQHMGIRNDSSVILPFNNRVEGGAYIRRVSGKGREIVYVDPIITRITSVTNLLYEYSDKVGYHQGYYGQNTWSNKFLNMALTGGLRYDHLDLTDETTVSPRASLGFSPINRMRMRLGYGQYTNFPDLQRLYGSLANPNLQSERAINYNGSIEYMLTRNTQILAEAFYRNDQAMQFTVSEELVRDDRLAGFRIPYMNSLFGNARGFEVSLHRRSVNKLSGWFSYSFMKSKYTDQFLNLINGIANPNWIGDYDQTHAVSAYTNYRLTNTLNVSGLYRYGSGLPNVGFFSQELGDFTTQRNSSRVPFYSRFDVRANKEWHFEWSKLTLSGEVLNVLNRVNIRQNGRRPQKLLPLLPAIGLSFEF